MSTESLLLEIGTEEIPSGYFDHILDMLSCKDGGVVKGLFEARNVRIGKASCYSTPRRIILYIEGILKTQSLVVEGPPARIAFDDNGKPTKALDAFLKKNKASLKDAEVVEGKKEKRVRLFKKAVSNKETLERILPDVVELLDFPKTMRWDDSGLVFARPIRWVLGLFGNEILRFSVGSVRSSNITHGHRFLGHKQIKVKDVDSYFKLLEKNHVIWDNEVRKEKMLSFLQKKRWHENNQLFDEVVNLLEYPFFIEGSFKKEYLSLPKDVLLASMAKHQRIFCLKDKRGDLDNRFCAVLNGNYRGRNKIRKHYEHVLDAKLKDALFFYKSDTERPLSGWAEDLGGIVFHKQLGTLKDKIVRLKSIVQILTKYIKIESDDKQHILRAVLLCKADLLTNMVKEFPSLQGVVGRNYALESGEDEAVAEAIGEHYLPRFADDEIPRTELGTICSLADKLDNIVSYFKIGKFPKGGRDLYALRRQGVGVISILLKNKIAMPMPVLFDCIYDITPGDYDKKKLGAIYQDFFRERFISFVKERFSYRYDLVESVTALGTDDLYNSFLKLETLNSIIDEICFEEARCIVERTHNIAKPAEIKPKEVKASLLKESEEQKLYDQYKNIKKQFEQLCLAGEYAEATKLYGESLSGITHDFFDKVMVNVDDKSMKDNRLALLLAVNRLYVDNIADLSKMVVEGEQGNRREKEE